MADESRCVTLGLAPSFGFGDRIGLATAGHVAALRRAGSEIAPIFPQQSIREMHRTHRTPAEVMADGRDGARRAGWAGAIGADADHLKTPEDVAATAEVGFTFFTIDPSDHVDPHADDYDEPTLRSKFAEVEGEVPWLADYRGQSIPLPNGTTVTCDEASCLRAAVKYGRAIGHALLMADHIRAATDRLGQDHEIELSVDETEQPTTLAEHYIIAHRMLSAGVKLVSLAPRFVGDFEKGVDFKGDLASLERSLADHAAIAEVVGPYKLSLHSGSDKLSMYPILARATRGRFHVKTAGTSYLEALRVVARHDEVLFRQIIAFARGRYPLDKATYHVSATTDSAPPAEEVPGGAELEKLYLGRWSETPDGQGLSNPGRQILHCTFGSTLTHPEFGPAIRQVLVDHADTYIEVLADHFARHLDALRVGL